MSSESDEMNKAPHAAPEACSASPAPAPKVAAPGAASASTPQPGQMGAPTPPSNAAPAQSGETSVSARPNAAAGSEATPQPQATPATPAVKPTRFGSVVIDTVLVLALVGAIGYVGWFLHKELPNYQIPSPIEQELEENKRLTDKQRELISRSEAADISLAKAARLKELDGRVEALKASLAEGENTLKDLHTQTLGVQHEIRQADQDARSVALGLLPGLRVGNVTTRAGKHFANATIYRVEGSGSARRLVLRSTEGQASFYVRDLVRDNLPDLLLYAFGYKDLVDMSDFTQADGEADAAPKPQARKKPEQAAQPRRRGRIIVDGKEYRPEGSSPVVDTEANRRDEAAGQTPDQVLPSSPDEWQAPTGDIPI